MMSVACTKLARYGMRMELHPYRIVNKYGFIVQNQHFDLRDEVLKAQENIGFGRHLFTKPYPDIKTQN